MTDGLLALADWLEVEGVTHLAMESTGVFWKPLFNLLEDRFQLLLVNARDIKQVPGRKTDVKDCEWIADLLRHGLLKASFVPDRPQRELRELVRYRTLCGYRHKGASLLKKARPAVPDPVTSLIPVNSSGSSGDGRLADA